MNLGNFFDAIGTDKVVPIVPRPVELTLTCSGDRLPNGRPNPGGRPIRGSGTACMVPISSRDVIITRVRARALLAAVVETLADPKTKMPAATTANEEELACRFEQAAAFLREWDPATQIVGPPLFNSAEIALDFLSLEECTRLVIAYNDYMREEHPTEVDQSTRNKSQEPGGRVAAGPPR